MPEKKLSLDEAIALLDKQAAEAAAKAKTQTKKRKEVKDLLKAGAKQGLKGLGVHTKRLLEEVED